MELTGLPAVVMQHETDHLDGVLMQDRALPHLDPDSPEAQAAIALYTHGLLKYYGVDASAAVPEVHDPVVL